MTDPRIGSNGRTPQNLRKQLLKPLCNIIQHVNVSVYDAAGKIPDGVLSGNTMLLGSFSSCYEVVVSPQDDPAGIGGFGGRPVKKH